MGIRVLKICIKREKVKTGKQGRRTVFILLAILGLCNSLRSTTPALYSLKRMQQGRGKKNMKEIDFFTKYGDDNRYQILQVIWKESWGVVCAALDTHMRGKVAIKKLDDVFEHISDALCILREVKLLCLLRQPDIVDIKIIMLPPSKREFKYIYVVFKLLESDLHQVMKANDDLTRGTYHQFFLYQMLRALKYMHTGALPWFLHVVFYMAERAWSRAMENDSYQMGLMHDSDIFNWEAEEGKLFMRTSGNTVI